MFEIQTFTLCDGWINTWLDSNDNPVIFETYSAAAGELTAFLRDNQADYDDGFLQSPENPSDYRVVRINTSGGALCSH